MRQSMHRLYKTYTMYIALIFMYSSNATSRYWPVHLSSLFLLHPRQKLFIWVWYSFHISTCLGIRKMTLKTENAIFVDNERNIENDIYMSLKDERNIESGMSMIFKNSKWVWSGNTSITNCRPTRGIVRRSHTTIMTHQEDKPSKATSSLFPIKMIAKLEWT